MHGFSDYKVVSDNDLIQEKVAQVVLIDPWTTMQAFCIESTSNEYRNLSEHRRNSYQKSTTDNSKNSNKSSKEIPDKTEIEDFEASDCSVSLISSNLGM